MSERWRDRWSLLAALVLSGCLAADAASAAELPAAPPTVSPQPAFPCSGGASAAPRRSPVHVGTFDVHFSVAAGGGQPLHVGIGLSLVAPAKHPAGDGGASSDGTNTLGYVTYAGRNQAARSCKP